MAQNTSHAVMAQRVEQADSLDDFPTPPWATRAFISHYFDDDLGETSVWEPACGRGHMAQVLSEFFSTVRGSDVFDYGYLSWRRRVGKSRAVATIQWENLLGRVGIWTTSRGNPDIWYRATANPMALDHFVRMEAKLATAAQVHPRVKNLILKLVNARLSFIEEVRFGRTKLPRRAISDPPKELLAALQNDRTSPIGPRPMKTSKLVAIMTIVMDFSALYTTRDWSVTAFLSTVAGAVPPAVLD